MRSHRRFCDTLGNRKMPFLGSDPQAAPHPSVGHRRSPVGPLLLPLPSWLTCSSSVRAPCLSSNPPRPPSLGPAFLCLKCSLTYLSACLLNSLQVSRGHEAFPGRLIKGHFIPCPLPSTLFPSTLPCCPGILHI